MKNQKYEIGSLVKFIDVNDAEDYYSKIVKNLPAEKPKFKIGVIIKSNYWSSSISTVFVDNKVVTTNNRLIELV